MISSSKALSFANSLDQQLIVANHSVDLLATSDAHMPRSLVIETASRLMTYSRHGQP